MKKLFCDKPKISGRDQPPTGNNINVTTAKQLPSQPAIFPTAPTDSTSFPYMEEQGPIAPLFPQMSTMSTYFLTARKVEGIGPLRRITQYASSYVNLRPRGVLNRGGTNRNRTSDN